MATLTGISGGFKMESVATLSRNTQPFVPQHRYTLADFRSRYWAYYSELLNYKHAPPPEQKGELSTQFDKIFNTITGYEDMDNRIAKTLAKKTVLLRVLEQPCVPLHNNTAELGARAQARVRDVSFQTRSDAETLIKDTFMTTSQTAKKLGVSFYDYFYDRVSGQFALSTLADLIIQKTQPISA